MIESFPSRDNYGRSSRSKRFGLSNPFYKGPKITNNDIRNINEAIFDEEKPQKVESRTRPLRPAEIRDNKNKSTVNNKNEVENRLHIFRPGARDNKNKANTMLRGEGQFSSKEGALMNEMANMQANYEAKLRNLRLELHKRSNSITSLEEALMIQTKTINDLRDEVEKRRRLSNNVKIKDRRRVSESDITNSSQQHNPQINRSSSHESSQAFKPTSLPRRKNLVDKSTSEPGPELQPKAPKNIRRSNNASCDDRRASYQRSKSISHLQHQNERSGSKAISTRKISNHFSTPLGLSCNDTKCGDSTVVTVSTHEEFGSPRTDCSEDPANVVGVFLPPIPQIKEDQQFILPEQEFDHLEQDLEIESLRSLSSEMAVTAGRERAMRSNCASDEMLRYTFLPDRTMNDENKPKQMHNDKGCSSSDKNLSVTSFDEHCQSSLEDILPVKIKQKQSASHRRASTSFLSHSDSAINFCPREEVERSHPGPRKGHIRRASASSLQITSDSRRLQEVEKGHHNSGNSNISYRRHRQRLLQQQKKLAGRE